MHGDHCGRTSSHALGSLPHAQMHLAAANKSHLVPDTYPPCLGALNRRRIEKLFVKPATNDKVFDALLVSGTAVTVMCTLPMS